MLRRERLQAYEALRDAVRRLPRAARAKIDPLRGALLGLGLVGAAVLGLQSLIAGARVARSARSAAFAGCAAPRARGESLLDGLGRSAWNVAVSALLTRLFFGRDDTVLSPPPVPPAEPAPPAQPAPAGE